jgi:peroxiredoxin
MRERYDLHSIPEGLPIPIDDGACDHLEAMMLPSVPLESTDGGTIDLARLQGRAVVYVYPRTGRPEEPGSDVWDAIPGARGCTPQSCGFRDHHAELRSLGVSVFGLSTQTTDYQREAVERLHLPFALLSDSDLAFTNALRLPTFEFEPYGSESAVLLKRMACVIRDRQIEKVFYPVFPPDTNAEHVLEWLKQHTAERRSGDVD